MKKLFTLRNSHTGHYVPFVCASGTYPFFEDKQDAKAARNWMNEKLALKKKPVVIVVSRGPDNI